MGRPGRLLELMTAAAVGFAVPGTAAPAAAGPMPAPPAGGQRQMLDGTLKTAEVEPGRYELLYAAKRLVPRTDIEQYLLYRAALLASAKGAASFSLLYLPGEEGPARHPAPAGTEERPAYGHWQPHWNYYVTGLGWQPWHPEWGAAFWSDGIDPARVERYEVHAIIRLSDGNRPEPGQPDFSVDEVLRDLAPRFR